MKARLSISKRGRPRKSQRRRRNVAKMESEERKSPGPSRIMKARLSISKRGRPRKSQRRRRNVAEITTIESYMEDFIKILDHYPQLKCETAAFLARCFTECTPMMLSLKNLLKGCSLLLPTFLNDSDPTVRDHAAEALGAAMKVVGEKAIMPFLAVTRLS